MHLHFPLRHRACRSSAGLLKFARLEWETDRGRHSHHVPGRRCCSRKLAFVENRRCSEDDDSHTFAALPKKPSHLFKSLVGNLLECSAATPASSLMLEFSRAARSVVTSAFPLSHLMLNQGEKQNWHAELIL